MSEPVDVDALLPPGTVLSGKYEVARVIGRGGMGVVVEARHLKMRRDVALKILLPAMRLQHDVVARFEREARAAAQLHDKHVARVLDVDTLPDGSPFMVMELLRGKDLGELLVERGKLPYREAVGYVLEACAGMGEAHRAGIVHRDLKPGNLFLDRQGGAPVLKILDFGISKVQDDQSASMTATTTVFGTPLYMSPEQVRSTKNVDARADIWSLGIVLYELLAGEPPFSGPNAPAIIAAIIADRPAPIGELRPDLPPALAEAVMRALEKAPDARYPDVHALAAAIAPFGPDGAALPATPSIAPPSALPSAVASTSIPIGVTTRLPAAGRPLASIAVGMAIAFAAGGTLLVMGLRRAPHAAPSGEPAPPRPSAKVAESPVISPADSAPPPIASAPPTASVAAPPQRPPPLPAKGTPSASMPPARPAVTAAPAPPKPPPPSDDPRYL